MEFDIGVLPHVLMIVLYIWGKNEKSAIQLYSLFCPVHLFKFMHAIHSSSFLTQYVQMYRHLQTQHTHIYTYVHTSKLNSDGIIRLL